jgi:hypothetical protein
MPALKLAGLCGGSGAALTLSAPVGRVSGGKPPREALRPVEGDRQHGSEAHQQPRKPATRPAAKRSYTTGRAAADGKP